MPSDPNSESGSGASRDREGTVGIERRPLLKALGVGAGLSLGSGVAAADDDHGNGKRSRPDDGAGSARIDPLYGFATPDAGSVPSKFDPDHEVELHVAPPSDPEDPERPTFFFFSPVGLHVEPGDVVQFTFTSPDHTVTAYHPGHGFQRRVPEGVPPFSSPIVSAGGAWLYRFDEEGVYDLYCGPHHVLGMAMRVVVGEVDEVPEYVDTFEVEQSAEGPPLLAPFSAEFLEHELNAFSAENEGCEWPWLTPAQVLGADKLDPAAIRDTDTGMSFATVVEELGYSYDHSHG